MSNGIFLQTTNRIKDFRPETTDNQNTVGSYINSVFTHDKTTQETKIVEIFAENNIIINEAQAKEIINRIFGSNTDLTQREIAKATNTLLKRVEKIKENSNDYSPVNFNDINAYLNQLELAVKNSNGQVNNVSEILKNPNKFGKEIKTIYNDFINKNETVIICGVEKKYSELDETEKKLYEYTIAYENKESNGVRKLIYTAGQKIGINENQSYSDAIQAQKYKDFAKELANATTVEEKIALITIATHLSKENKMSAEDVQKLRAQALDTFTTQEQKVAFEELIKRIDNQLITASGMEQEEAQILVFEDDKTKTDEQLRIDQAIRENDNKKFYTEENKQKLSEIEQKIINGEFLTEKEQELYSAYTLRSKITAATNVAIFCNNNLTEEQRNAQATALNETTYNDTYGYKETLKRTQEFANKQVEELKVSTEEFSKYMDKATNNNYTKVIDEFKNETDTNSNINNNISNNNKNIEKKVNKSIENNNTTNKSKETTNKDNTNSTISVDAKTNNDRNNNVTKIINNGSNQSKILEILKSSNSEAIDKYFNDTPVFATIDVLKHANQIKDEKVIEKAYETYQKLSNKEQADILLGGIDSSIINTVIRITRTETLIKYCSGKINAQSTYATNCINEATDEAMKKIGYNNLPLV